MKHEEEILLQLEDDALADPSHAGDRLPMGGVDGRVVRAEQRDAGDPNAFEPGPNHETIERFDVDGDVRKLGHFVILPVVVVHAPVIGNFNFDFDFDSDVEVDVDVDVQRG